MERFVRLEIRLVMCGINLWRGRAYKPDPRDFSRFVLPTVCARPFARWRKPCLVPVLTIPGISSASIAIAKRQLKRARPYNEQGAKGLVDF